MERMQRVLLLKFNSQLTMSIKAIIIEDEKNNVELLKHFIVEYCDDVKVQGTAARASDGIELIRAVRPQIIFLDIMLEQGTGFDILDEVKELNAHVIFITAFNEHAIRAFKYSAIDYLMKPLQIDQLVEAVDRAKKLLNDEGNRAQLEILISELKQEIGGNDTIAISMIDRVEIISLNSILYIEADGKYSSFHLADEKRIVSSKNLGEYEKLLAQENNHLVRIHNSFIVNSRMIESIKKGEDGIYCILSDGSEIPVSRRKRDRLRELLKL